MTPERRLAQNIKALNPETMWVTQGTVTKVNGASCTVMIGDAEIEGVRLRASLSDRERQMLVVPKVGSPVTLGCLTADLNNMVVLQVDEIESITINGGELGGLVKIQELTEKINELVDAFNRHTHTIATGAIATTGTAAAQANAKPVTVPAVMTKADRLRKEDYEDIAITH
jgi:hypothetical protein